MTRPARSESSRTGAPARPAARGAGIGRVLVLADGGKGEVHDLVAKLEPWLASRVREVSVEIDVRAFYKRRQELAVAKGARESRAEDGVERPDLVVVLGGDGAILAAVRAFAEKPVPTIGINFGRVGFLASADTRHWKEALTEVLEGRAVVEPRMRLKAELQSGGDGAGAETVRALALNDVVMTRGAYQGMLEIALKVGDDWVTNYRADGLIVATASGSTAYSLAAGGPILAPTMHDLVLTPICPQALSHRSIVLPTDGELSLVLKQAHGITTLVVDGQGFYTMKQGDRVKLSRHPLPYPLLARPGHDFFKRLRDRLGWRGSFEPDVFPIETAIPPPGIDTGEGGVL